MNNRPFVLNFIIASISAIAMTIVVMIAMPSVQPALVSTAAAIGGILSADASWADSFVNDMVVPALPIILPVSTFLVVLWRMSTGRRPI